MKTFGKKNIAEAMGSSNGTKHTKCFQVQQNWANWLSKKTASYSKARWAFITAVFTMVIGGSSMYLLYKGIMGTATNSFTVTAIKKSKNLSQTGELEKGTSDISQADYDKLIGYEAYLKSLSKNPSNGAVLDSILTAHPGLQDSLRTVIQFYQPQFKKGQNGKTSNNP